MSHQNIGIFVGPLKIIGWSKQQILVSFWQSSLKNLHCQHQYPLGFFWCTFVYNNGYTNVGVAFVLENQKLEQ